MVQTYPRPIFTPPAIGVPTHSNHPEHERRSAEVLALLTLVSRMQVQISHLESERRQLVDEHRHLDTQLDLAAQIQADLQPKPVAFAGLEIQSLLRPLDRVSGDLHDIVRYDDDHLGISLADVSGHGMPAALLTALLRRAFRGDDVCGEGPKRRDPREVLRAVNAEMLAANLTDCQFVTGLHAAYDRTHRTLTIARGGAPYPILLRSGQAPQQLVTHGPLLGALPDTRFESVTIELAVGDAMLFCTDGIEALLVEGSTTRYRGITDTPWFSGLSADSLPDALADIEQRLNSTRAEDWPADDVSLLAVRVTA